MTPRRLKQYDAIAKAITDVVAETRLAYQFAPGSYTMGALNAAITIAQVYEREAAPFEAAPDWIALYLDHHDSTTTNRRRRHHDDTRA